MGPFGPTSPRGVNWAATNLVRTIVNTFYNKKRYRESESALFCKRGYIAQSANKSFGYNVKEENGLPNRAIKLAMCQIGRERWIDSVLGDVLVSGAQFLL